MRRAAVIAVLVLAACSSTAHRPAATITLSEYERLTPGMSYAAAVDVMGSAGTRTGDDASLPDVAVYEWVSNAAGTPVVRATFIDGALATKTATGLP